jgi:hypothetical protein
MRILGSGLLALSLLFISCEDNSAAKQQKNTAAGINKASIHGKTAATHKDSASVHGKTKATKNKGSRRVMALHPDVAIITNETSSPTETVKRVVDGFQQQSLRMVGENILSIKEYMALFPSLPENDGNPNTAKMMKSLHISAQNKNISRWMEEFKAKPHSFSRVEIDTSATKKYPGFRVTPIKLWVNNGQKEVQSNVITSLVQTKDGYKVWGVAEFK